MKLSVLVSGLAAALVLSSAMPAVAGGGGGPVVREVQRDGALLHVKSPRKVRKALDAYTKALDASGQNVESVILVKKGKIVGELWRGEGRPDVPHVLHSVSKSFTSTAVGFAVAEGRLSLDDRVVSFFPDKLPATVSDNLAKMTVRHLLTMTCGQAWEIQSPWGDDADSHDWVADFLAAPVPYEPGTHFVYNSVGTYMLSAILQKATGQKVADYLAPRLFAPLGISDVKWEESPQGINNGGWGLYLKTDDLAKMGQFLLQEGAWNGKQLLPKAWVRDAVSAHVLPGGSTPGPGQAAQRPAPDRPDWAQGYGYQFWRCRYGCFRADGSNGQYIIVCPGKEAVIAVTANLDDMQAELNLIWEHLLPVL